MMKQATLINPSPVRSRVLTLKVQPAEMQALKERAEVEGVKVSQLIREALENEGILGTVAATAGETAGQMLAVAREITAGSVEVQREYIEHLGKLLQEMQEAQSRGAAISAESFQQLMQGLLQLAQAFVQGMNITATGERQE